MRKEKGRKQDDDRHIYAHVSGWYFVSEKAVGTGPERNSACFSSKGKLEFACSVPARKPSRQKGGQG